MDKFFYNNMRVKKHCGCGDSADNLQVAKKDDAFIVEKSTFSKIYLSDLLKSNDPKDKIMMNSVVAKIVKHDHKDSFEYLIDHGYKINVLNDQNQTAIHLAIYNKSENILEWGKDLLLSNCAININHTDSNGLSHLHFACMAGKKNAVKKFLKEFPDINARWYHDPQDNRDGFTPLHFAVTNHRTEIIKYLLHEGAEVNSTDSLGRTLLHLACCISRKFSKPQENDLISHPDWNSEMKIMKLLVAQGADLNFKDKLGNTPLLSIFKNEDYRREIKYFEEDFILGNSENVKSLLKRQKEKLDYLMERGVDITVANNNGENILHRIIGDLKPLRFPIVYDRISFDDEFHAKLIDQLLSLGCGIDINERNNLDQTPLLNAISFLSFDIVKVLLDHSADVNDLKFNYQDKNFFNYPAVLPNLKAVRNLFSILDLLEDKGFYMTLRDELAVLQFLIHEVQDCECVDSSNFHVASFNMLHTFCYGTPKHISHVIDGAETCSEGTELREHFRSLTIHNLYKYLKLCKMAKMYYSKDNYRMVKAINNCSLEDFFEEAKKEIARMKCVVYKKGMTLYDFLIMDIYHMYDYVEKCEKVDKLVQRFNCYRDILEGRITLSLSQTYFMESSPDYLRLLTTPLLPDDCCDLISYGYLSNRDLWNVYLAVAGVVGDGGSNDTAGLENLTI